MEAAAKICTLRMQVGGGGQQNNVQIVLMKISRAFFFIGHTKHTLTALWSLGLKHSDTEETAMENVSILSQFFTHWSPTVAALWDMAGNASIIFACHAEIPSVSSTCFTEHHVLPP